MAHLLGVGRCYYLCKVPVDLREPYLDFARRKAASENLTNVKFEKGDVRALPFADATFDIVWHKYLLPPQTD
jgi:ubiquinone/menaquinone biosynthesis C-methylase UbiE